jgi:uncharacterized protein YehS (DUF1456 family)
MNNFTNTTVKIHGINQTNVNQTTLNNIILHVTCAIKTGDLSKLFESNSVPLSKCQILE